MIIVFVNDAIWTDLRLSWYLFEHLGHNQSEFIIFTRLVWHELPLNTIVFWHSFFNQVVNSGLESQQNNVYEVWKL